MAAITLATLRTRIRQRSDNEHTGHAFVTDAELNQLINTSFNELYGLLVRAGLHRAESTDTITADGSDSYALPADFYAVLGVFRLDGNYRTMLPMHDLRYRGNSDVYGSATSYRVMGSAVTLLPKPQTGTYELWYIPIPGDLTADDDTVDGVLGWEEYLVIDCAIKVLQKEESDTRDLKEDRERIYRRIQDEAASVEATEGWRIANVRGGSSGALSEGNYTAGSGYRGSLAFPLPTWRW